jgi:hypothetical protein
MIAACSAVRSDRTGRVFGSTIGAPVTHLVTCTVASALNVQKSVLKHAVVSDEWFRSPASPGWCQMRHDSSTRSTKSTATRLNSRN